MDDAQCQGPTARAIGLGFSCYVDWIQSPGLFCSDADESTAVRNWRVLACYCLNDSCGRRTSGIASGIHAVSRKCNLLLNRKLSVSVRTFGTCTQCICLLQAKLQIRIGQPGKHQRSENLTSRRAPVRMSKQGLKCAFLILSVVAVQVGMPRMYKHFQPNKASNSKYSFV